MAKKILTIRVTTQIIIREKEGYIYVLLYILQSVSRSKSIILISKINLYSQINAIERNKIFIEINNIVNNL